MAEPTQWALERADELVDDFCEARSANLSDREFVRLKASVVVALDAARQQGYQDGRDAAARLITSERAPGTWLLHQDDQYIRQGNCERMAAAIRALTPTPKESTDE